MKRILKCIVMIIGTIVGAGFASGKEIYSFFGQFLEEGILGIVVASFLFGIVTYSILLISTKNKISNYRELIKNNVFLHWTIKIFIFLCFCIMLSGIGTYVQEEWNISFWIGTISASLICFFIFLFQMHGLEKVNLIFVPIILVGVVLVYFFHDKSANLVSMQSFQVEEILLKNWFQSAVLYVGYNSIVLIPILVEMKQYILNRREILEIGGIVMMILCFAGLMISYTLYPYGTSLLHIEIPMLAIAKTGGNYVFVLYSIVMMMAIFTTAISAGYAFLKMNQETNYFKNNLLICILGILVARIGFSNLVNICFPIFGYLGIIQLIYIMIPHKKIE